MRGGVGAALLLLTAYLLVQSAAACPGGHAPGQQHHADPHAEWLAAMRATARQLHQEQQQQSGSAPAAPPGPPGAGRVSGLLAALRLPSIATTLGSWISQLRQPPASPSPSPVPGSGAAAQGPSPGPAAPGASPALDSGSSQPEAPLGEAPQGPDAPPTAQLVAEHRSNPVANPLAGLLQLLALPERASMASQGGAMRCGMGPLSPADRQAIELDLMARTTALRMAAPAAPSPAASVAPSANAPSFVVPVYIHVVSSAPGVAGGDVRQSQLDGQMAALNAAFGPCRMAFALNRVFRYRNATWSGLTAGSQEERALKAMARKGARQTLNLYTAAPSSGTLGFSAFPWTYAQAPVLDGVVINFNTLPGGALPQYNKGYTGVHEVGHWLGLYHTFEGGCRGQGDWVADTAPEAYPAYDCATQRRSCSAARVDPANNYMDYSFDACMTGFTPGQCSRMLNMWRAYRSA